MRQLPSNYSQEMLGSARMVGLVLGLGSLVALGAVCVKPATNTNVALNSNANINSSISNGNENTNSGEIDTSDWLTFNDNDLGIQFLYPTDYQVIDEEVTDYSDTAKYDSDINAGRSKRLVVQSKEDSKKQIILVANTSDRKSIYDMTFTGGDLTRYCDNLGQVTAGLSYCDIIENHKKEYLYRNEFVNMECSPRFNTSIGINNPNISSDFSGLEFNVALPDIQTDLLSGPFKDNDPCAGNINIDDKLQEYLQTSFSENNLSVSDKNLYEITKTLVQSVQSI